MRKYYAHIQRPDQPPHPSVSELCEETLVAASRGSGAKEAPEEDLAATQSRSFRVSRGVEAIIVIVMKHGGDARSTQA